MEDEERRRRTPGTWASVLQLLTGGVQDPDLLRRTEDDLEVQTGPDSVHPPMAVQPVHDPTVKPLPTQPIYSPSGQSELPQSEGAGFAAPPPPMAPPVERGPAPPPPMSGVAPSADAAGWTPQMRTDYMQQMGRQRKDLPDAGINAQDRYDYGYGKRHDKEGRLIDRDKGPGSAFKNFMKGLGIGFLRGGLGGAIAGGIMNTARGNMDEEFAWNTWHKPRLEQDIAQTDARTKQEQESLYNQQRIDTLRAQEDNLRNQIDTRTYNATKPVYETQWIDGVMFQRDKNGDGQWRKADIPNKESDVIRQFELEMPDGTKEVVIGTYKDINGLREKIWDRENQRNWQITLENYKRENKDIERQDKFESEAAEIEGEIKGVTTEHDVLVGEYETALQRINFIDNQLNGLDPEMNEEQVKALRDEKKDLENRRVQLRKDIAEKKGKLRSLQTQKGKMKAPTASKPLRRPSSGKQRYTADDINRIIRQ